MNRKKDLQDLYENDGNKEKDTHEPMDPSVDPTAESPVPLKRDDDHPEIQRSTGESDAGEASLHEDEAVEMSISELLANEKSVSEAIVEEALAIEAFTDEIAEQEAAEAQAEENSEADDGEEIRVDIYAIDIDGHPVELYDDTEKDEVLDTEEEITEETVEEATREAIEEVTADIEGEEEILAEQRPQEMERSSNIWRNCWIIAVTPISVPTWLS